MFNCFATVFGRKKRFPGLRFDDRQRKSFGWDETGLVLPSEESPINTQQRSKPIVFKTSFRQIPPREADSSASECSFESYEEYFDSGDEYFDALSEPEMSEAGKTVDDTKKEQ